MQTIGALRRSLVLGSSMCALMGATRAGAETSAIPPDTPAPSAAVSEVVVTGSPYALQRSIEAKREKSIVSDTISANEIGSIPEFGLGEALQRLPGVNFIVNNGRGEAQFETIRGLNPDYNTVTIDGVALPSTEETRRSVSFDVLPSVIANQASVYKTYTADEPSDAIGGVTNIQTHSAFDHPGLFVSGDADASYWDSERLLHRNYPSGEGDFRISQTFGSDNQFGALLQLSYYERSSNSLNSYTLPYSYYNVGGPAAPTPATPLSLAPNSLANPVNVAGLTPVPDRRRWYTYDNIRQRPGAFAKFEWDDHHLLHAHLTGGVFMHTNDEYRSSQYLNKGATAPTFTSSGASFPNGQAESDFDKYNQYREISYVELGGGATLDAKTHIDAVFNYGFGFYRQNTTEDVFTTASNAAFAFNDIGEIGKAQLFVPVSEANFHNPTLYNQTYTLTATDKSKTLTPQERIDFVHNMGSGDTGFGFSAGYQHRETRQTYFYHEFRYNPLPSAGITLATIGPLGQTIVPYDANGMNLLLVDPSAVAGYLGNHLASYSVATTNLARSSLNNFAIDEVINAGYLTGQYRRGPLFANFGLRYETTDQDVTNYVPNTFVGAAASFPAVDTPQNYNKLLPALNISYDVWTDFKIRAAVSRNLARPRFSDLGQNSALTVLNTTANETVANPHLVPRTADNYDLSFEYYPRAGTSISTAVFWKDISNEIFSLTTTTQNAAVPGCAAPCTLTLTQPRNLGRSQARGLELSLIQTRLDLLAPAGLELGWLRYFGLNANASLNNFDAPRVQLTSGAYRKLPQLLESAKGVVNVALTYNWWRVSGEAAYNHTSKQPLSFDLTNPVNDQWYRSTDTVDVQLAYRIAPRVSFRVQCKNVADSKNQKVVGPNQSLNYSLLDNGRAYYAGVSFAY